MNLIQEIDMRRFRIKYREVLADQWLKIGDVPEANVQRLNVPQNNISQICNICKVAMVHHGIMQDARTMRNITVCPRTWFLKPDANNNYFIMKPPKEFESMYELVPDQQQFNQPVQPIQQDQIIMPNGELNNIHNEAIQGQDNKS